MFQRKIKKIITSVTENSIRQNCIYIFYKSSDEISRESLLQELNASFTKWFPFNTYLSKNIGDILVFLIIIVVVTCVILKKRQERKFTEFTYY